MKKDWNSILFDNIGQKIQNVAKFFFWFDVVLSIIAGIVAFVSAFVDFEHLWPMIFAAPVIVIVGFVVAWLSVFLLYAFGKLVEDVDAIRQKSVTSDYYNDAEYTKDDFGKNKSYNKSSSRLKSVNSAFGEKGVYYECPVCGCEVKRGQKKCLCFSELNWDDVE